MKIFGFVFNQGVSIDGSFYNDFGEYPRVENFNVLLKDRHGRLDFEKAMKFLIKIGIAYLIFIH